MPDLDSEKFILNQVPCSIHLEDDALSIKFIPKTKQVAGINDTKLPTTRTIHLSEILTVKCQRNEIDVKKKVIISPKKKLPACVLQTFKRSKDHKWKLISVKLKSSNESHCEQWTKIIQEKLSKFQVVRPQSLLVFVNPSCGRGVAEDIYEKKAKPIFDAAGVKTRVIITKHRNHARSHVEDEDISEYDGIIAVGGDGMLNEVINGLMTRTQSEHCIDVNAKAGNPRQCPKYLRPDLRVGIIPAGSTDCVSYVTNGVSDAETAALHIVIGDSHPIDVTSLHNADGVFQQFSLSLTGYGFYGDVLRKSESVRWMGPPRYSYVGVNVFLQHRSYSGEVHYLPGSSVEGPKSSSFCRTPCNVCQDGFEEGDNQFFTPMSPNKQFLTSVSTTPMDLSWEVQKSPDVTAVNNKEFKASDFRDATLEQGDATEIERCATHCETCVTDENGDKTVRPSESGNDSTEQAQYDGAIRFTTTSRPSSLLINQHEEPTQNSQGDKEEWQILRGNFIVVNAVPISCACERSPLGLSPASHLADGELDLVIVRSCSRIQFFRFLVSHMSSGDRFDFPFVEVRRVKAFQFIPTPTRPTYFDHADGTESSLGGSSADSVQISLNEMSVKYSRSKGRKKKTKKSREVTTRSKSMSDVAAVSTWNSDGEVVKEANMTVRVHRGLLLMFCRGVEDIN